MRLQKELNEVKDRLRQGLADEILFDSFDRTLEVSVLREDGIAHFTRYYSAVKTSFSIVPHKDIKSCVELTKQLRAATVVQNNNDNDDASTASWMEIESVESEEDNANSGRAEATVNINVGRPEASINSNDADDDASSISTKSGEQYGGFAPPVYTPWHEILFSWISIIWDHFIRHVIFGGNHSDVSLASEGSSLGRLPQTPAPVYTTNAIMRGPQPLPAIGEESSLLSASSDA
mgnify:CR=1 FL=1